MTANPPVTVPPDPERLVAELQFLGELAVVVASNTELQPILDWIVQKTTAMLRADEGSIKLLGPEMTQPTVKTLVAKRDPGIGSGSWPPQVAMNVMGFLMAKNEPLATPDLVQDSRFVGLKNLETRVRAVLAVPLKVENRFTGMLAVTHAEPGRVWRPQEVQLLTIVAANSAAVIEQARLRHETREVERMQRELGLAREIQMNLVPSRPLHLGRWQITGRVVPAREIGGDAFDYFLLGPDRAGIAIADVVGKGVPAALLMSNVQASLRAFCDGRSRIPDALRHINQSVSRHTTAGKFITFFYAELDAERGRLFYSNAGHNFPLLQRADGTIIELTEGGLPLGILEESEYELGEHAFAPGDSLLLFSDGITEALDLRREEYGDDRLRAFWSGRRGLPPADTVSALLDDVQQFRGRAEQSDDMTVVVVGEEPAA